MKPACEHCDDTGSLSKEIEGQMDCAYCSVARERADLEVWALREGLRAGIADLWLIFQHGRAQGLEDAEKACEKVEEDYRESQSGKWPELRDDAETGAGACVAAIRAKRGGNDG